MTEKEKTRRMTDEEKAREWVIANTGFNPKEPLGKIAVRTFLSGVKAGFQQGAEFGYNKANEWHEIESKVTSKREISMQYMPKNKEKVLLKYRFFCDDEIHISDGYYDAYYSEFHIANKPEFRIAYVIAWKEIVAPKESE